LSESEFKAENKRTNLQSGDVLLTIVGTIGRSAVYEGEPPNVTFQRSVCVIRPKGDELDSRFLHYYLLGITEELNSKGHGVAQKGIYLNQVRELIVPVPALEVQREVVARISHESESVQQIGLVAKEHEALISRVIGSLWSS